MTLGCFTSSHIDPQEQRTCGGNEAKHVYIWKVMESDQEDTRLQYMKWFPGVAADKSYGSDSKVQ